MELEVLQDNLKEFKDRGAAVVALCPQRNTHNQAVMQDLNLNFPVVQDRGNQVATAFGLTLSTPPDVIDAEKFLGLDLPSHNGSDNWDLPMPARYAVDQLTTIRYASINVDHRMRSDPADCLTSLRPTELRPNQ